MRPRLVGPAAFLVHLMYAQPSLQKALAQEAQTRGRLRADKKACLQLRDNRIRIIHVLV